METKIEYVGMGTKPDPFNFKIEKYEIINGKTIIMANYEGCTSFGGSKLILLDGIHDPTTFTTLDPHFIENHLVIARFIPNQLGWELAKICAEAKNTLKPRLWGEWEVQYFQSGTTCVSLINERKPYVDVYHPDQSHRLLLANKIKDYLNGGEKPEIPYGGRASVLIPYKFDGINWGFDYDEQLHKEAIELSNLIT